MNRAQIMVLGTFHFVEASSILPLNNEKRQNELKSLINKIIKFKPNKLCVELRPNQELNYNELYKKYLADSSANLKSELAAAQIYAAHYYINDPVDDKTLDDIYRFLNMKETNELQHSTGFIPFNYVGEGDDPIGITFVSDWYRRNLHILANLHKIAQPDDRILILYGAGHRKLLSDFINESPDLEYVDSLKYL